MKWNVLYFLKKKENVRKFLLYLVFLAQKNRPGLKSWPDQIFRFLDIQVFALILQSKYKIIH